MAPASGSWKTTSGLLDDFDFDIEEAWFGLNDRFGDTLLLNLRGIASQEGEVVDEEHVLLYSTGEGWEAAKGGREANHSAGKTTFVNNTNIGRLIDAIVGLGDEVIGVLSERGDTWQADTWEGLRFHIERKQFSYRNRETGEQVTYEVPLPTDFLGEVEAEEEAPKKAPAKKGGAKAPAKGGRKPKAKAEPEEETEAEEEAPKKPAGRKPRAKKGNAALRSQILETASEYEFDGHADFVDWVFDPEQFDGAGDLQNDEELSAEALDEDGALWQAVLDAS